MAKIVVAGGTGFIGTALIRRLLDEGHSVIALTRRPEAFKHMPTRNLTVLPWDGQSVGEWAGEVPNSDAVINLAGEGIADKRWTKERKFAIKASRMHSTQSLVEAVVQAGRGRRPKVFINASAVGYYGNVPQGDVTEDSPKGKGFLADTCADWEEEARKLEGYEVRVVMLRFGVVLEKGGGALKKMVPPFLLFAGGPLGSGRQWLPWVHREDVLGTILFALDHPVSGPVNVTAPEVVTMKDFSKALGRVLHRPSWAPVPGFMLYLLLGEMASMLLTGQKAVPHKLAQAGYRFQYPQLGPALAAIFAR